MLDSVLLTTVYPAVLESGGSFSHGQLTLHHEDILCQRGHSLTALQLVAKLSVNGLG